MDERLEELHEKIKEARKEGAIVLLCDQDMADLDEFMDTFLYRG